MKKLTLALCLAALTLPLCAAESGFQKEFTPHWKISRDFTLAVAEAMPAGDYSFRPNKEEMSFGQQMVHIGMANASYFGRSLGQKMDMPEKVAKFSKDKTVDFSKEEAISFLKASFDFCTNALESAAPEKVDQMVGPEGHRQLAAVMLWGAFTHTAHHRGQAEVYLRIKNIVPPPYKF